MPRNNNALAERLDVLSEECGEVVQIIGKSQRHGIDSEFVGVSNTALLEKELGDILAAIKLCAYNGDVDLAKIEIAAREKMRKFKSGEAFLHHQTFRDDWDE